MRLMLTIVVLAVVFPNSVDAQTSPPKNFADCVLVNMRGVGSDEAAKLIGESCALKYPDSAPNRRQAATPAAASRTHTGAARFDGRWTWEAAFPGGDICFPTRAVKPMMIKNGTVTSNIFVTLLGTNPVEGTVRPGGDASFWGSSSYNLVEFMGHFSGNQGSGTMIARNDNLDCVGGTWKVVKVSPK